MVLLSAVGMFFCQHLVNPSFNNIQLLPDTRAAQGAESRCDEVVARKRYGAHALPPGTEVASSPLIP